MAKKTKKEPQSIYDLAVELQEARHAKNEFTALEKKLASQLKARMEEGEEQDLFGYEISRSLEITNNEQAVQWVQAHYPHLITVDATAVKTILQRSLEALPEGFNIKETKRLVELTNYNNE